MKEFAIKAYLVFYQFYLYLWNTLFRLFGNITFIYHVNEDKIKNITLNYYLKYNLEKFKKGIFYTKIYSEHGTHHVAFDGEITHINKLRIEAINNRPKRKNVILLNNGLPINIDLDILDNYKNNMKHFDNSIKNLGQILKIIGLNCSHVTIIQFTPFTKKTVEVHQVDIDHLYVDKNE